MIMLEAIFSLLALFNSVKKQVVTDKIQMNGHGCVPARLSL